MTSSEIRETFGNLNHYAGVEGKQERRDRLLLEIAAQLAEANELTARSQAIAEHHLAFLEKDFAFRTNPNQFVAEIRTALDGMLGVATSAADTPAADAPQAREATDSTGDPPRRRHH